MAENQFAVVVNCSDGTVQDSVRDWMSTRYRIPLDHVDIVAVFAADKVLSENSRLAMSPVLEGLQAAIQNHPLQVAAIVGHESCTTNPVSKADHLSQIRKGIENLTTSDVLSGLVFEVIGLWVDEKGEIEIVMETTGFSRN